MVHVSPIIEPFALIILPTFLVWEARKSIVLKYVSLLCIIEERGEKVLEKQKCK